MNFKVVGGGVAPKFSITVGLREGYGPTAKTHTMEEVVELVLEHLKWSAANNWPYLTGSVMSGEVVYAWPEGPGKSEGGHEPQVTYSGEINPLYNAGISRETVENFLNGLATILGSALGQTRVYIAYNGEMWILQAEASTTPTGETI